MFLIIYFTQEVFLTNDDEYDGRPKLTEQLKPVEYIVPPPLNWLGTNTFFIKPSP